MKTKLPLAVSAFFALCGAPVIALVFALCWMFDDGKEPSYAK
jgi:hypothetical protein